MTKKAWVCHANTDPCALMRASSTQGHMTGITKNTKMSENSFIQLYTINLPKYFMCMECFTGNIFPICYGI